MKVFLRYYVELPFPLAEIDRTIAALPGQLLDAAARDANLRGLLMLGSSATTSESSLTAADVCVSLSPPQTGGSPLRRALQWCAVRGETVHPVLRGDLELAELGPSRTQLAITAQYQPPGEPAQSADRTVAQRVGESTLKAFLDRLGAYIQLMLGGRSAAAINVALDRLAPMPLRIDAAHDVLKRVAP